MGRSVRRADQPTRSSFWDMISGATPRRWIVRQSLPRLAPASSPSRCAAAPSGAGPRPGREAARQVRHWVLVRGVVGCAPTRWPRGRSRPSPSPSMGEGLGWGCVRPRRRTAWMTPASACPPPWPCAFTPTLPFPHRGERVPVGCVLQTSASRTTISSSNCSNCSPQPLVLPEAMASSRASFEG